METSKADIDVAVNIFAKPYQTSLALLSLLRQSRQHINKIWLQYEPVGSQYDPFPAYCVYEYIKEKNLAEVEASQPSHWIDLEAADPEKLPDPAYRHGIRYQYAFENSKAPLLFLMHNDVFILRDILGAMRAEMGDAIAIGQFGQCWNCPAANSEITQAVMGRDACSPANYQDFKPTQSQLLGLYEEARKRGVFARPYDEDGFSGDFSAQPWPLPECRVNEWACLVNLEKSRPLTYPFGDAFPIGAYKPCGSLNLDIGVVWLRDMHKKGFHARHFDVKPFLKHWVGTGNNTPIRYARSEANAEAILKKHFPEYMAWISEKYGQKSAR